MRRRRRRWIESPRSACTKSPEEEKKHFLVYLCLYLCISTCHVLSKSPIVGEDVDKGERHGEGAEEDVGHGQGGDEDVPRGQHHL